MAHLECTNEYNSLKSYLFVNIKVFSRQSFGHYIFSRRSELSNMFYGFMIIKTFSQKLKIASITVAAYIFVISTRVILCP